MIALTIAVVFLVGCGDDVTGPSEPEWPNIVLGSIYGWDSGYYGGPNLGDGAVISPDTLIGFDATFMADTPYRPVIASLYFVREDGEIYENEALTYGPFISKRFEIEPRFRVIDGLLAFTREAPGQLIQPVIRFNNGPDGNGQIFRLSVRFYVS